MEYLEHRTKEGDRWDAISTHFYGDPYQYERIISANPRVLITPTLPAGTLLKIPLLPEVNIQLIAQDLPPWKQ